MIEKVGALGSRIHLADREEPIEAPGYPVEIYNILGPAMLSEQASSMDM